MVQYCNNHYFQIKHTFHYFYEHNFIFIETKLMKIYFSYIADINSIRSKRFIPLSDFSIEGTQKQQRILNPAGLQPCALYARIPGKKIPYFIISYFENIYKS